MIKTLVVDDSFIARIGIIKILKKADNVNVVGEAVNGYDAIEKTQKLNPNLILMDIHMPKMSGLEAIQRITQFNSDVKIIALTMNNKAPIPSRVMSAGAKGFITKDSAPKDLLHAIYTVSRGRVYISPQVAQDLAVSMSLTNGEPIFSVLSKRELQIMEMVINCRKVPDISKELKLSSKTVNGYRYRIFEKLHISSDLELALLAMRHGFIDKEKIEKFQSLDGSF